MALPIKAPSVAPELGSPGFPSISCENRQGLHGSTGTSLDGHIHHWSPSLPHAGQSVSETCSFLPTCRGSTVIAAFLVSEPHLVVLRADSQVCAQGTLGDLGDCTRCQVGTMQALTFMVVSSGPGHPADSSPLMQVGNMGYAMSLKYT